MANSPTPMPQPDRGALVPAIQPCTKCGGEGKLRASNDGDVERVACLSCNREGPFAYSAKQAVDEWNYGSSRSAIRSRASGAERLLEALGRAVAFSAYRAEDPLAIRFAFANGNDRLAAANAVDAALSATPPDASGVERLREGVIPAGMVPWHGGDSAPADWDGGAVRLADGEDWGPYRGPGWASWDLEPSNSRRIIAYTPKSTPTTPAALPEAVERIKDDIADLQAILAALCLAPSTREGMKPPS